MICKMIFLRKWVYSQVPCSYSGVFSQRDEKSMVNGCESTTCSPWNIPCTTSREMCGSCHRWQVLYNRMQTSHLEHLISYDIKYYLPLYNRNLYPPWGVYNSDIIIFVQIQCLLSFGNLKPPNRPNCSIHTLTVFCLADGFGKSVELAENERDPFKFGHL